MTNLTKGANTALTDTQISVTINIPNLQVDVAALGVKADGKIYAPGGNEWISLFSQPQTAGGAISLEDGNRFEVSLMRVPADVEKIVFAASMEEGSGKTMANLTTGQFQVDQNGQEPVTYNLTRGDITGQETSLVLGEIYRRNGQWKVRAVGAGYNNGFAALLQDYGVQIAEPTPEQAEFTKAAATPKISLQKQRLVNLEKKLGGDSPIVSLAKTAAVSLEKAKLGDLSAMELFAVIDTSGSMDAHYKAGKDRHSTMQEVLNRLLAAAGLLDDDGIVPVVGFDNTAKPLAPISLDDYDGYIERAIGRLGAPTNYAGAMKLAFTHETENWVDVGGKIKSATMPRLVFFLTDGKNDDKELARKIIREASKTPTFFVCVGIGGGSFPFLEELDNLSGRLLDNASTIFKADITKVTPEELYKEIFKELPGWLAQAREIGLVNDHPEQVAQNREIMQKLDTALAGMTSNQPPPRRRGGLFDGWGRGGPQ